ncbi:MAG TPA: hypothetical protein ENN67_01175, partial [Firmicutes bacterium]|nr:hypothetical protein [Bacillota bacterium]
TSPNNPSADLNRDETEMPKFLKASDALQEVMAEFKKQNVDFVILLADTDTDVIDTVLESVDGIDLVVHSQIFFNKSTPIGPKLVNDSTRIVQIGGNGELVGRLRLDFQPDGAIIDEETMLAELDPSVPVDGAIAKILYEYKLELRKNRDEYMTDPGTPFARYISPDLTDLLSGYTGINICISCHQQYAIDVQLVGHRDAWRRLPTENLQDPNCLPCHTTGWGVPTGLANPYRDTHLTGVTCEACHGPGADHARDMYKAKGEYDPEYALPEENPTGLEFSRYVPRDVCIRCHTPEWSPNFDYETWVPRVNHSIIGERQREPQDGTQWTPPPEPPE